MAAPRHYHERVSREEVFESSENDKSHWSEADATALFESMQQALHQLVRKYEVREEDLRNSLDVISQLWEMMAESLSAYDSLESYRVKLEDRWEAEKNKRRQVERRKADIESRFDEERFLWQKERQRLESEKAAVETKLKQARERNMELVEENHNQTMKLREDQITRNDLLEQYKKQYEFARTSSLRRRKKKPPQDRTPSMDFSPPNVRSRRLLPSPTPPGKKTQDFATGQNMHRSSQGPGDVATHTDQNNDPRSRNVVSLKTEMSHKRGSGRVMTSRAEMGTQSSIDEYSDDIPEPMLEDEIPPEEDPSFAMTLQQELLAVSPDLLAPAAAELDMLRREKERHTHELKRLELKKESIREQKEKIESDNAQLSVEVEQLKKLLAEQEEQLREMRLERDEILETYLDQPFDVYCVTKKELHEVLKKLHLTQMEVQKQTDEKNILQYQLERKKKKSAFKKFADKVKTMFRRPKEETMEPKPVERSIVDLDVSPYSTYHPQSAEEIRCLDSYSTEDGWLVHLNGMVPLNSLPPLYCQLTLKEYHVTEQINCIARGRVYYAAGSQSPFSRKRRLSLLPLAARTRRGQLCVEVWVSSSEESANFIEVIDVLAKVVKYRFLIKGSTYACCMQQIPGRLPDHSAASYLDERSLDSSPELSSKQLRENSLCSSDSHLSPRSHAVPTSSSPDQASDSGDRDSSFLVVSSMGESSPERTPPMRSHSPHGGTASVTILQSSGEDEHRSIEEVNGVLLQNSPDRNRKGKWQTSTPKPSQLLGIPSSSKSSSTVEPDAAIMWVATDNKKLQFYSLNGSNHHRPMRQINLPEKPHCLEYCDGKVFVGLDKGKMLVFHTESIGIEAWDIDNPVPVDLPSSLPEETFPVSCVTVVKDKVWVGAGPHLYLLENDAFNRTGVRFLDGYKYHLKQFLCVGDFVLVNTFACSVLFVLTADKAVTVRKFDFSHVCLLLDRPVLLPNMDEPACPEIAHLMKTHDSLYVTTSTGKVIIMPLEAIMIEDERDTESSNSSKSGSFPSVNMPDMHQIRTMSAISLNNHRGDVRGILHVPLPENMGQSLENGFTSSTLNSTGMSSLGPATSLPNLLVDSVASSNSTLPSITPTRLSSRPVYRSLLISAGKGHKNYLLEGDGMEEDTAIRERNDAHQLMVWGFPNTQVQ